MTASRSWELIIVDLQNDFCECRSLAVPGGAAAAGAISRYVASEAGRYAAVVATTDWHEDPGAHFSDAPDYVDSWPVHCRIGTDGALIHSAAEPAFEHVQAVFRKGVHQAAYSGFEGVTPEGDRQGPLAGRARATPMGGGER